MTLIAAFWANDTPVLMGDFMISRDGSSVGGSKKISMISPNFVIAWTGHQLAAVEVLTDLHVKFSNRRVTLEEVEAYFTGYQAAEKLGQLCVHLVFWIVTDQPRCFLWNSLWPEELFPGDCHFDGSGAKIAERLVGTAGRISMPPLEPIASEPVTEKSKHLVFCTLIGHIMGKCMEDESIWQINHQLGVGIGYECLYLHNGNFRYWDNITYMFAMCIMDQHGKVVRIELGDKNYRYIHTEEHAVLIAHECAANADSYYIISPAYKKAAVREDAPSIFRKKLSSKNLITKFLSKYPISESFCVITFFFVEGNQSNLPPFNLAIKANTKIEGFHIGVSKNSEYEFNIHSEWIEFAYQAIKSNHSAKIGVSSIPK